MESLNSVNPQILFAMNPEQLLRPQVRPTAPGDMNQRVWQQIKQQKQMKKRFFRRMAAVAAVVVGLGISLPLILISGANAAPKKLLAQSIERLVEATNYQVEFALRTQPNENFAAIDPAADFVQANFVRSFESPYRWRIGYREGRTALFTGDSVFVWLNGNSLGFCGDAQIQEGVLEGFSVLLEPRKMLANELSVLERNASQATMSEQDGLISLVVETPAKGNFDNPYMLNTSVGESYSRRTYLFDQRSKLLTAFTIEVIDRGAWVKVIESQKIAYNQPLDASLWQVPTDVTWRDMQASYTNNLLTGISAQKAVERILEALERSNIASVKEALRYYDQQTISQFYGLKMLSVGEPFASGSYCGVFIPCRVKLKDGTVKKYRLAMRNDNENKVWTLDGGI